MSQYIEKYKKNIAIDMRKRGLSYSEIENRINVPRSTLSYWLKDLKLSVEQIKKLNEKRLEGMKRGSEKKSSRTKKLIEEIRASSAKSIKIISKKELWLIGTVLYWRERLLSGNENDLRKGVKFTSSDPYLVKLFLKWLQDIGRIKNEEIEFDIFMKEDEKSLVNETVAFWSDVTEFPEDKFRNIYFQKVRPKRKRGRRISHKTKFGLLRTRVKASSMLARQIAGWVRGIIRYYWE
ncbi:MAG: hypothetical protein Q8R55_01665 [Candidatus Taylorbacteria bacterium]|nr:hypothetical protein [Candidatus Taylorbacteria bacterium]